MCLCFSGVGAGEAPQKLNLGGGGGWAPGGRGARGLGGGGGGGGDGGMRVIPYRPRVPQLL